MAEAIGMSMNAELLADRFRQLRGAWFNRVLKQYPPQREWTTREDDHHREWVNAKNLKLFEEQTEAIIRGEYAPLSPMCTADLHRKFEG